MGLNEHLLKMAKATIKSGGLPSTPPQQGSQSLPKPPVQTAPATVKTPIPKPAVQLHPLALSINTKPEMLGD